MDLKQIKATHNRLLKSQNKNAKTYAALIKLKFETTAFEIKKVKEKIGDRELIQNAAWSKFNKLVVARSKRVEKLLDRLHKLSADRNGVLDLLNNSANLVSKSIQFNQLEDWTTFRAEIRKKLKVEDIPTTQINTIIKRLDNFDPKQYAKKHTEIEDQRNELVIDLFNRLLKQFIENYYTHCCIQTSTHFKENENYIVRKVSIQALEKKLNKYYADTKASIAKREFGKLDKFCQTTTTEIQNSLEKILLPSAAALLKKKETDKKTFNDILESSIKVGTLIRESILFLAFLKRVNFYVKNRDIHAEMPRYEKAALLGLPHHNIGAKSVAFSSLADRGKQHDLKEVKIKGRVVKVLIKHVNRKPISTVIITDGVYIIPAVIPHIKIDSSGLVRNTYVEMAGIWHEKNKETNNKPALMIDRINHTDRSRNDWYSWLVLEMNDVFDVMPHSINANMSWKQGRAGAINPIKFSPLKVN